MDDVLALQRRRDIHAFISKYPGSYFNEIKQKLNINTGVLQHHITVLEKMELVSSEMEGARKRYFVRSSVPYIDRRILAFVRLKSNRDILIFILEKKSATFHLLSKHFGISKATLSFHMKKLVDSGLVIVSKMEREKVFSIYEPDTLARVLITYKESFLDDAVDRFIKVWEDL